jgi:hypothetical protein
MSKFRDETDKTIGNLNSNIDRLTERVKLEVKLN